MTLDDAIRRYISVARPILLQWGPRNNCIQSTRACVEVFRRLGFAARPQAVQVVVTNHEAKTCQAMGLSSENQAHAKATCATWTELHDPDDGWQGHLVAIIDDHWYIDSSIDQVQHGVAQFPEEPFAFRMPVGFQLDDDHRIDLDIRVGTAGPLLNIQIARSDDTTYEAEPAWTFDGLLPVRKILLAMQGGRATEDEVPMFVFYRDAKDVEWPYVVRRWTLKGGNIYADKQLWGVARDEQGLRVLRADLEHTGYVKLERNPLDDAVVMEVWV